MKNAILQLLLNVDPNHTISIMGIVLTAGIAIYSIRKTAEVSRVTSTYSEMKSCLIETVLIFDKALVLLDGVARKIVYYRVPERTPVETAYNRYWKEIGPLANRFKEMQAKQKLVLPSVLYEGIQKLIRETNLARELVKGAVPDENHIYPDTSELQEKMESATSKYKDFINMARCYLGASELIPLSKKVEDILNTNEEAEGKT